jgi:elongation factor 1-alpha
MPQTREHAALAFTLGVDQIVVAINKMDLVNFDRNAYEKIKQDLISLLGGIGYKGADKLLYVPVAAFHGDNVTKPSPKMPWYDGPTIEGALEVFKEPDKPLDKPLRLAL